MLHVYLGTDRGSARANMWESAQKIAKKEEATIERIVDGAEAINDIRRALAGGGLFSTARVVLLDGLLENAEVRDSIGALFEQMEKSPTPFFIFEEKLDAETKRSLKKHAEVFEETNALKKEKDNSVFAVANALGARDRKKLWISYISALVSGSAPEAIHGMLFWKVKSLLLANGRGGKFKEPELRELVGELAELPHEARRGGVEFEFALEKYILETK